MENAPPPYSQAQGYPPQQGGYPPQQGGYPPQQPGYPPQQPGYPPAYSQPQQPGYPAQPASYPATQSSFNTTTTTVIAAQPTAVTTVAIVFHEFPVTMICPSCKAQIVTAVTYEPGTFAYMLFFLMCIFGFWICCFFPFCIDSCKDSIHSCPNCRSQLGVFRRM
eukprot:Seg855.5 transcript_id=Seg855.5/GoldUCD/mRNA.D3Y31 product="Lipopolysaccharide-induced tumor necrosis factor-alpha factor" protein_id=Seg855.5/GoldUCD/D3Y31